MELNELETLAGRMRASIESISRESRPDGLADFPYAACSDASLLLGAYFVDLGIGGFVYVAGERGDKAKRSWVSHAWLAKGVLVVDITADQFADAPAPIIVARPSPWHQRFRVSHTDRADFRNWQGASIDDLGRFYRDLRPQLFGEV